VALEGSGFCLPLTQHTSCPVSFSVTAVADAALPHLCSLPHHTRAGTFIPGLMKTPTHSCRPFVSQMTVLLRTSRTTRSTLELWTPYNQLTTTGALLCHTRTHAFMTDSLRGIEHQPTSSLHPVLLLFGTHPQDKIRPTLQPSTSTNPLTTTYCCSLHPTRTE
jgi:hypothetical protein